MNKVSINQPSGIHVIAFKIFYAQNKIVVGKGSPAELKEAWDNAPNDYVQLVMLYYNETDRDNRPMRYNFQGSDFYAFDGESFSGSNDSRELSGSIKNGKWISDEAFESIRDKALDDYIV